MTEPSVFWYGDNLTVMREHIVDDSVDLIYLDPPFNSKQVYNRFFSEADGAPSDAQRKAFEDYWRWGSEAQFAYDDVVNPMDHRHHVPAVLSQTMEMFRTILHESNLLAYLSMMAVRLVEMRRVLKRNGSLYLHCDPTASHYLKLLLDALFGQKNFRGEIIWKRSGAHSDSKQGRRGYGRIHDTVLFYTKTSEWKWTDVFTPYADSYLGRDYRLIEEGTGRRFRRDNLTAAKPGGDTSYDWRVKKRHGVKERWVADLDDEFRKPIKGWEYKGIGPYKGRYWAYSKEKMRQFALEGRLRHTFKEGRPEYKRYLDEGPGVSLQDLWTDIPGINSGDDERVGYPTQKPISLLERIIRSSTKEGDLVLDPFCGCGTAVVAAQRLNRKWIGIDVTHVAVSVLKQRIENEFPDLKYRVRGEPTAVSSARRLAEEKWEEFQAWIVDKVGGIPLNPTEEKKVAKKGKDGGIDGYFLFRDDQRARSKRIILSVKAGKAVSPSMIDSLYGVVKREGAAAGALLLAYPPTPGMKKTALRCGHYTSETFDPGKKYPNIQIVSVEDIFDPKGWRGLSYPGENTSRRREDK